jgi:broad specificity phosphatase PhoE
MLMNQFYIARHGETQNNRAGRLSGWIDTPLTSNGLVPTLTVIAKLREIPIDEYYSSDSGRAFITAYVIAQALAFSKEIVRVPDLREVNYGDAGNMNAAEAYQMYDGLDSDTQYTPPNGESLAYMQARVLDVITKLDEQHSGKNVLLVAHSGVMAAIHASFIGTDFGEYNISQAYPHDYVASFTITDGKIASFTPVSLASAN